MSIDATTVTEAADSILAFKKEIMQFSQTFITEAIKENRDESAVSLAQKNLEDFIKKTDQDIISQCLNALPASALFFLGLNTFNSNKLLAAEYLNLAYLASDTTTISSEESEYTKKHVISTVLELLEKEPKGILKLSVPLRSALKNAKNVADQKKKSEIISLLLQSFEYGANDKIKNEARKKEEVRSFQSAIEMLISQKKLEQLNAKELWAFIQELKNKIDPEIDSEPPPYTFIVEVNFFTTEKNDFSAQKIANFSSEDRKIVRDIKAKIENFITRYKVQVQAIGPGAAQGLRETLMIDAYRTGKINNQVPLLFSAKEKALIKRYYDIKQQYQTKEKNERMINGLNEILKLKTINPFKAAAHLFMLIVNEHPFEDGNGRVARLLMNDMLRRAGFAVIQFPERDAYNAAVRKAGETGFDEFEKFMRECMQQQHKIQAEEAKDAPSEESKTDETESKTTADADDAKAVTFSTVSTGRRAGAGSSDQNTEFGKVDLGKELTGSAPRKQ